MRCLRHAMCASSKSILYVYIPITDKTIGTTFSAALAQLLYFYSCLPIKIKNYSGPIIKFFLTGDSKMILITQKMA